MNILADGRSWSRFAAGVGSFFSCAIMEWARQRPDDRFYIILPKGLDARCEIDRLPANITLLNYAGRFPKWLPNIIVLQLLVPGLCRKLDIDLYYAPVPHLPLLLPNKVKTLITVHDVVNIEMADTMSWTNRLSSKWFFGQAVRKADMLWTNSYYTKSKVEQYFPQRRALQIFVGDAADRSIFFLQHLSDEDKQAVRRQFGIDNKFILFVGSLEPRKNLDFLLRIISDLYRSHHLQLVVVGGKGWKNSSLKDIVNSPEFIKESTIFCGFVSNEDLTRLYNTADCFVSAALMEGFGMPQLEALLCGCPIVTAHNSAMIEVAKDKDGALTVEGYDEEDWKQAIVHMTENRNTVNQSQLSKYDWHYIIEHLQSYVSQVVPKLKRTVLAAILFLLLPAITAFAEIPIVAYYGVPLNYSNVNRFKEFRNAGFDVSICFYDDTPVDTLVRILNDAQKAGVRLLISSGWVSVQPQVGIPVIKDHPALYGYFLQDEPWPRDFPNTTSRYKKMAQYDTRKPVYVNLLPDYGEYLLKETNMQSYKKYVQDASAIGLPQISFDFYPIRKTGIRDTWYSTLETVRQESLRTGKPFWAFALCTPHCDYPQPTLASLRLQIYSNLAYGAKAIQYFTYWTPKPTKEWDFHDAPISLNGKRTKNYALVKKMNEELRGLLPLFDGAEVTAISHMVKIPKGTMRINKPPHNIKRLIVAGQEGAIISTLKKNGKQYAVIVNKDYKTNLKIEIEAKESVKMVNKRLESLPLKSKYEISGGDMIIFKLD